MEYNKNNGCFLPYYAEHDDIASYNRVKDILVSKTASQEDLDKALFLAIRSCAGPTLLWFNHKPSLTSLEICQMLINAGANVNYKPSQLESHLKLCKHLSIVYFACLWRDYKLEILELLKKAGISDEMISSTQSMINKYNQSLRENEISWKNRNKATSTSNTLLNNQLQNGLTQEQQEYIQSIIDIIEKRKKTDIEKILLSDTTEQYKVVYAISIFGDIPIDALEKDIPELNDFILKLMLIVKKYFGDDDCNYKKYEEVSKKWFDSNPKSLIWFKRCQTLDKTLISNPEEPIKYPPILSGKVLTKKLTPPKQNNQN